MMGQSFLPLVLFRTMLPQRGSSKHAPVVMRCAAWEFLVYTLSAIIYLQKYQGGENAWSDIEKRQGAGPDRRQDPVRERADSRVDRVARTGRQAALAQA